jgi:hypothetical protein
VGVDPGAIVVVGIVVGEIVESETAETVEIVEIGWRVWLS